jgi:hypothetical protein
MFLPRQTWQSTEAGYYRARIQTIRCLESINGMERNQQMKGTGLRRCDQNVAHLWSFPSTTIVKRPIASCLTFPERENPVEERKDKKIVREGKSHDIAIVRTYKFETSRAAKNEAARQA